MDDKVMPFVPEYIDNSIQFNSIQLHPVLIQFVILLDYKIRRSYRTAWICEYINTGAAQAGLQTKQKQQQKTQSDVNVSADWTA